MKNKLFVCHTHARRDMTAALGDDWVVACPGDNLAGFRFDHMVVAYEFPRSQAGTTEHVAYEEWLKNTLATRGRPGVKPIYV